VSDVDVTEARVSALQAYMLVDRRDGEPTGVIDLDTEAFTEIFVASHTPESRATHSSSSSGLTQSV
jgi:hypothetical protein